MRLWRIALAQMLLAPALAAGLAATACAQSRGTAAGADPAPIEAAQPATLQAFGAAGDGRADDTAAVAAALGSGRPLFCQGRFRLTGPVVAALRPGATSFVAGTGRQGCQMILAAPTAALTINGSAPDGTTTPEVVWSDVAFVAAVPLRRGAALTIAFPPTGPSQGRTDVMVSLRDIVVSGAAGGYPHGGIHLVNVLNSVVEQVTYTGNQTGSPPGYARGSYALLYDGAGAPVTTTLRDIVAYSADTCIHLAGTWQGVKIEDPTCVTARIGALIESTDNASVLVDVTRADYAVEDFGVRAINIGEVNLINDHVYLFNSGGQETAEPTCFSIAQSNGVALFAKIVDSHCDGLNRSGPRLARTGVALSSQFAGPYNMMSTVADNSFNGLEVGIRLDPARSVHVGHNHYTGVATPILNTDTTGSNTIAPPPLALPPGASRQ